MMTHRLWLALTAFLALLLPTGPPAAEPSPAPEAPRKVFRAGASAIDISPESYPVIINGNFFEATAHSTIDPLYARALVLDDGTTRLALVVVDSCMMPRDLLDDIKKLACETTGIPPERMLISATHTHSAPSVMGVLGSGTDERYRRFLSSQVVRGLHVAVRNLQPARVGWAVIQDHEHTHCRRWIYRADRMLTDPFGVRSVRANMHPGNQNPAAVGPAGPVDADLSLLAVQSLSGRPLAVLANYSMHYYGASPVSADYFGAFAAALQKLLASKEGPAPVVMMSQGTSGDQWWMDYGRPAPAPPRDLNAYAAAVAKVAYQAYQTVRFQDRVPLTMRETRLTLRRRVPDDQRLAWAHKLDAQRQSKPPRTIPEVYAREQLWLHERPTAELKLQAIRIGDLGIAALPNEVFGITGLKIKAQSPLRPTFTIELANGSEGYIPPPEQFKLGGYTTWPARTAGLEEQAEPRIVAAVLDLLEQVAGKPRQKLVAGEGPYSRVVLASQPAGYWRLAEFGGPTAHDATGKQDAVFEDGIAFYLEGPPGAAFAGEGTVHRAVHCAGGRVKAAVPGLGRTYSVELWFWNGQPNDARPVTGYLFSRGPGGAAGAPGDHLGLGGTSTTPGRLLVFNGNQANRVLSGSAEILPRTWNHVVLVREDRKVTVYLNGNPQPEINGDVDVTYPAGCDELFFGGRNDRFAGWEGKLAEVALYGRALSAEEARRHYQASGRPPATTSLTAPPSPEQAQTQFCLPPGLRIELVAAEPDVQSPVAMAFDEDGRLWVVEMRDYPNGPGPGQPAEGRIRVLDDRDGSGRFRAATVLADRLLFANGVLPWKGGAVVTAAPSILYLRDSAGDGQADQRLPLYEGFAAGNPQLRVSHPTLGMDNWIYVANGLLGGRVRKSGQADAPVIDIGGRDFRFDLIRSRAEAVTGMGQYGNTFDDWGQRFVCSNRIHWLHLVLPDRYIRRNPFLAVPPPPQNNQGPGGAARVYPLSQQVTTFAEHAGSFTAACGVFVYRGSLLPEACRGSIFTCEPTGNLVHQEILLPTGATFTGRPARQGVEFLATTDGWFRPVFLSHGPDGALYVVDMCRKIIEHPEWMPPGPQRTSPELTLGKDRGRIWRIVPDHAVLKRERPRLGKASTAQLVRLLAHPDVWWRTTAQRLLLERQDPEADQPLRDLVRSSAQPLARVHAAWLLEHRGKLDPDLVVTLLLHQSPRVREHGVRLAEPWLARSEPLQQRIVELAGDEDARLRFQVALTLGHWDDDRILRPLARIALANVEDPWSRLAVASSVPTRAGALLRVLLDPEQGLTREANADRLRFVQELATLVGSRQDAGEVSRLLEVVLDLSGPHAGHWQLAARKGLAEGMLRRGVQLAAFLQKLPAPQRGLARRMDALLVRALAQAGDDGTQAAARIEAIQELAQADGKTARAVLAPVLATPAPAEIHLAAVRAAAAFPDAEVADLLLAGWPRYAPAVRREALEALLSRPERTLRLLTEMEAGRVSAAELDGTRRLQLINHRRSDVRQRAYKLLAATATPERRQVLDAYRRALKLRGDAGRGKLVFQKATCASCHRAGAGGVRVGPDLADVRTRAPESLLVDILDPNAAIDGHYVTYLVTLKNGQVMTGIITSETASSLTLARADQQTTVILRQDIETDGVVSTHKSLMPEGLEKSITLQEMADLLAFLRSPPELQND
jgi:putative membrane-bound dehydrogenase-like protein